ncbi:MAG: dienelactone hydrolase family protein [Streptosporangiaceae bacterium]|jgi:carboxymethylenebutenolidase
METSVTRVAVPDGHFDLHVWTPDAGHGPGILLIQEIYGVGDYIRAVGEDLARRGYVVGAPDMYWRIQPGFAPAHDEQGLNEAMSVSSQFNMKHGLEDAAAAYQVLSELPQTQGGMGLLGFCFGGTVAYLLAPRVEPDALVSFYGSEVPNNLDVLEQITCPVLFVFGGSDPYIPRLDVARVEQAVAGHLGAEILVEEKAGHAFHNRMNPMFSQPEPAARAWDATEEFLEDHIPVD